MGSAPNDVLVEVASALGSELREGAQRVQARGDALRSSLLAQIDAVSAPDSPTNPAVVAAKLQAAVADLGPLDAEKAGGRATLASYALAGLLLAALEVGQVLGRLFGPLFGLFIQGPLASIAALVLLPASYLYYNASAQLEAKDRHLAAVGLSAAAGLLNGIALRGFNLVTLVPEALSAVTGLLVSRFGAGALAAQADRTALLGALVGARAVVAFALDFALGGAGLASLLSNVANSAAYAVFLQLNWANQGNPGLGLVSAEAAPAVLDLVVLLPPILIELLLAPIAPSPDS